MTNAEQLRADITALEREYNDLGARLGGLKAELAAEVAEFKAGDVIEFNYGRSRKQGRVISARLRYADRIEYTVARILKGGADGAFCSVEVWHKPTLVSRAAA